MLKLKLQYFGHLKQRTDSLKRPWCWERLKAVGEGEDGGWDGWMASPTWWTWVWARWTGSLACCSPWSCKVSDMMSNWTTAGKNTGMGCHALLQGIFPIQGLNWGLNPTWHADSLPAELPGKPLGLLLHDNMWDDPSLFNIFSFSLLCTYV